MDLFVDIYMLLSHDRIDNTRSSGCSGVTIYANYNILRLLKSNLSFISKGQGVKNFKRTTKWRCYYLAAAGGGKSEHMGNRTLKYWQYSKP